MEKEKLDKIALITATYITDISSKTAMSWFNEIKTLKNIPIDNLAVSSLILESATFGHYYFREKIKGYLNSNDANIFADILTEKIILMLTTIFNANIESNNFTEEKNKIKEMYFDFFPDRFNSYKNYNFKDNETIVSLFKEFLRQVFNSNEFNIKFIESKAKNSFKFIIAKHLSQNDNIFLDNKVIYTLADSIFTELSAISYEQLNEDTSIVA